MLADYDGVLYVAQKFMGVYPPPCDIENCHSRSIVLCPDDEHRGLALCKVHYLGARCFVAQRLIANRLLGRDPDYDPEYDPMKIADL